jgi:hypothetical protein
LDPDPDPQQVEKADPDLHLHQIKTDPHHSDADPQHFISDV